MNLPSAVYLTNLKSFLRLNDFVFLERIVQWKKQDVLNVTILNYLD